ncbi:probable carbohydrate esterase At4g34215 [Abrus precatorius]|uniref:Probable carbohydrate esterase At4g34215 n=1 Tax=Abrus precatorius TaxID=3816 RepID=A0A8B8LKN0_ABRPR|nr:probable carbohydrate esterase At4g34215 [Abrus precatorius]
MCSAYGAQISERGKELLQFLISDLNLNLMPPLLLLVFLIQAWPVKPQADRNIFILAGQSNMAGRGGVVNDTTTGVTTWDGVVPPQCRPSPSILKLNAQLMWVEAREPLHADIDTKKTNGVGPGMAFANTVLDKNAGFGVVGLVPCAIGGTNISEWERGKELYNKMIKRAKASLHDGGSIRALLWYQGETDTVYLHDAQSYQRSLRKFFFDVRDDLQSPLLPIIQVALASGSGPYVEIVRQAQLGIDLLNLKTVDAHGLPLEPDGLHLMTSAQVDLGGMMANAFLQFVPSSTSNHNVSRASNEASVRLYDCAFYVYTLPFFLTFLIVLYQTFL